MASHYLRKYGVEATVNFELYELDGTDLVTNAASATGDINLIRDEAAPEELDADAFVDEGVVYSLVASAAEVTAKRITIYIIDQSSPKIWLDKVLIIESYGHASAQHVFDLGTAIVAAGPTKAEMDTAHGLLATPAQVNTQVLDVMNVDTFAEPAGIHAATASIFAKINFIAAFLRNKKTQTATTQLLRNDADDGTIATSTVSDDGTTATKGEFS